MGGDEPLLLRQRRRGLVCCRGCGARRALSFDEAGTPCPGRSWRRCCFGSGPAGSWLLRGQIRLAGLRRPSLEGNRGASLPRPHLLSALLLWGWAVTSHCCCGSGGEVWFVAEAVVLAEDNKYPIAEEMSGVLLWRWCLIVEMLMDERSAA